MGNERLNEPPHGAGISTERKGPGSMMVEWDNAMAPHTSSTNLKINPIFAIKHVLFVANPFLGVGLLVAGASTVYGIYMVKRSPVISYQMMQLRLGSSYFALTSLFLGDFYYRMKNYRAEKVKELPEDS